MAFGAPPIGLEDSDYTTPDEVGLSDPSDRQIGGRNGEELRDSRYRAGFVFWPGETRSGSEFAATAGMPRLEI